MDIHNIITGSNPSPNPYTIGPQGEYLCSKHENRECTFVCPSCVVLLCRNCLTENLHQNCNVLLAQEALDDTCDNMKAALLTRIDTLNTQISGLQNDLIQKRKRMVRKKNGTAFEIELFFSRLKDKLLAKLKKDEQELLKELSDKVTEQERGLMTFTELCNEAKTILNEKKSSVVSPSAKKKDTEVMSPYFKYLLKTSHELSYVDENRNIIQEARDDFLVIRFCVSSEVEKALMNDRVASVEVLHSRSDNPEDSLETQHIELVSQATGNSRLEASASEGAGGPRSPESWDGGRASSGAGTPELSLPQGDLLLIDFGEVDSNPALEPTVTNSGDTQLDSTPPAQTSDAGGSSTSNESLSVPKVSVSAEQNDLQAPTNTETSNITSENNSESAIEENTPDNLTVASDSNQTQGNTGDNSNSPTSEPNPDDPPPPYMGYTHASPMLTPDPEDPPPPYPGLSPPPYGHYLPQSHDSRPRLRARLPGVSESSNRRSGSYTSRSPSAEQMSETNEGGAVSPSLSTGDIVSVPPYPLFSFYNGELNDRRASGIFAMVIHEGYSFLMIDRWNKKLKYFSKDGVSIGGLIFREEPWDLASLGGGNYAITVPKLKTIYKVMASETDLITIGNLSTVHKYACVGYDSERKWLVCGQVPQFGEPVIDVMDVEGGPVLLSFRRFSHGHNFISYPRFVKVGLDGTCFVCDWNLRCLVVFKLDGTVIGQYRGTAEYPLIEPTGIELSKDMNSVFVIDSKHNYECGAIHKVSLDCQCQRIYRGPKEFRDARALAAFDNKIVIGSRNGNLSVYKTHNRCS